MANFKEICNFDVFVESEDWEHYIVHFTLQNKKTD
jgi:hypothetical protein